MTNASFAYQDPFLRTLYTQGRYLYDSRGQKVILRGVNLPLLDDWSFPQSNKLAELAKTGANAVRIEWYKNYGNASRPSYSLQDLDNILTQSSSKGIIPILGLWDATCDPNTALLNTQLIPWWTSPDVMAVLKKHQQHLIINLANELGFYHWAGDSIASLNAYKAAYKSAITSIRQQNLHVPIMIDAPDGGSALDVFNLIGQELINYDPDHNLLLSAHAYWAGYNGIPALNTAIQANLPIVFGEIANKQDEVINGVTQYGYYDLDGSNTNHPALNNFTYQSLLQTLKGQDIGWLSWSWWKDNLAIRQMTTTGNFANLTAYGNDLVNNTTYGLKTTAQLSTIFVTTFNGTNGNDSITGTTGDDAIYSLRGVDTINGGTGKDLLIVDYSSNSYVGSSPQGGITSTLVNNGSGGFNGSYKAYYSTTAFDQVNFSNIERFLLIGTAANDNILTGDGDDFLYGGAGADTLIGGAGNDYLEGGDGNDLITGINPNGGNFGKGEIDTFVGGLGIDKFILGDTNWIGYDDGNIALAGDTDYAQITDFNPTEDIIQLRGTSSNYLLTISGTNTNLYVDKPGTEPDELIAILQSRTGLTLTGSYFNYVSSPTFPTITLAVSPASVTENGTSNLVYTFTRTGATTNALTVNYAIAGTADSSDYSGATPGTGKTITFTAGSSTTTLTLDPTADTTIEPDETVTLTLATGTGYTIGNTTAVTGTILNDDYLTIESTGNTKLVKDIANNFYAQTGSNIPISIKNSGQPIYQNIYTADWQTLAVETINGENQVLWKNISGNYLNLWKLDSNWNYVTAVSPIAINSSQGYSQETNFGIDANGDGVIGVPFTTVEALGSTKLVKDSTNKYYAQAGSNTPLPIKYQGQQLYDNFFSGWQTLAVETVNGENQVLWKNITGNFLHLWHLDSNWNFLSSEGQWVLNSSQALIQEVNFQIDTNGDGKIGGTYTPIETAGNTKFIKDVGNNYYAQVGNNTPLLIKYQGQQLYQNFFPGWQTLATETVNGENQVLWKNIAGNFLHLWHLDSNWNFLSSEGQWALNSSQALTLEVNFQIDTDSDGKIGNPIVGTSGNDTLTGNSGDDQLTGGLGNDTLTGGAGRDRILYTKPTEGIDTLNGFTPSDDWIQLSASGFGGGLIAGNAFNSSQFFIGSSATTANQRVIYNASNGALWFDQDGNGAIAPVQLATLAPNLGLTNQNILIGV